ncbi:MAG: hypothetical protein Q7S94_08895, partial [Gallionella sp.]|nr:hypothetical protein [Gallionella sp.]
MKNILKQQGIALLVFVTILATAAAAVTVTALYRSSQNVQISRDKITAAALAQAKEALIGRAVTDENRPGSLPCPDTNNDGTAELFAGTNCPSYIGRLPWRTLGLPDISDGSRERLWYALSNRFRDNAAAEPINSDTLGNRPIYAPNSQYDQAGTLLTEQAIAVIFSAGDVLAGQNRIAANINNANHYLEKLNCPGASCRDNTAGTGPFIAGALFDANHNPLLNDQLLIIQTKDIIPTIEKRITKEANNWLQAYYSANFYYPYPAEYTACNHEHCTGNSSVCRGRFPRSEASGSANWSPPEWFRNNQWYREIYYSVGAGSLQTPAGVTCANTLAVAG